MGIEHVVVCGLFTDQCVSSTVRDLSDWGYTVFLVEDATSAINATFRSGRPGCSTRSTARCLN